MSSGGRCAYVSVEEKLQEVASFLAWSWESNSASLQEQLLTGWPISITSTTSFLNMAKCIYYMLAKFYFLDIFKESVDDRKYLDVNT